MAMALWFRDDDAAYLAWLHQNPDGFVLNMRHKPTASYLVLHRATCRSISVPRTETGGFTARGYSKACADNADPLLVFARAETGASDFTRLCRLCAPFAER